MEIEYNLNLKHQLINALYQDMLKQRGRNFSLLDAERKATEMGLNLNATQLENALTCAETKFIHATS